MKMAESGGIKLGNIFQSYQQVKTLQSWNTIRFTIGYNKSGMIYSVYYQIVRIKISKDRNYVNSHVKASDTFQA